MGSKAWLTYSMLITILLGTLYFLHRAFDGTTLVLETGAGLGGLIIKLVILMVVGLVVLQVARAILAQIAPAIGMPGEETDEIEEDERDKQIEVRGDRIAYHIFAGILTLLVLQFCVADMYPGGWWSGFSLDRPIEWVVAIVLANFAAEFMKWASMAFSYRPW